MILAEGRPASLNGRTGRLRYGLMSLSEMVNCHIASLCSLCANLMLYQTILSDIRIDPRESIDSPVPDSMREQVEGWMKIAENSANQFEWTPVHDRIEIIKEKLKKPLSGRDLGVEMRVLLETIEAALKWQLVYRYPQDASSTLINWQEDWKGALLAFPSARNDIISGVDLWALNHSTASVFQFMRVLEHGLRALAANVGLTFDIQNWQNIIDQIEAKIRDIGKTLPRGTDKNERLQFLAETAKEFVYFKDGWRNYVSHSRGVYDKHQARSVMEHVRSFMNILSTKLSE
jgi:hypothetical protein